MRSPRSPLLAAHSHDLKRSADLSGTCAHVAILWRHAWAEPVRPLRLGGRDSGRAISGKACDAKDDGFGPH